MPSTEDIANALRQVRLIKDHVGELVANGEAIEEELTTVLIKLKDALAASKTEAAGE